MYYNLFWTKTPKLEHRLQTLLPLLLLNPTDGQTFDEVTLEERIETGNW